MFANAWMTALGKRPEDLPRPGPTIANAAVTKLVSAFTLALVFQWLNIASVADGVVAALTMAAGLIVANQVMRDRFHGIAFKVTLINGANTLVVYAAMGAVLAAFGHGA